MDRQHRFIADGAVHPHIAKLGRHPVCNLGLDELLARSQVDKRLHQRLATLEPEYLRSNIDGRAAFLGVDLAHGSRQSLQELSAEPTLKSLPGKLDGNAVRRDTFGQDGRSAVRRRSIYLCRDLFEHLGSFALPPLLTLA